MKLVRSKSSKAIRQARNRVKSKIRNSFNRLSQKKDNLREKAANLRKIKKGFIEKMVSRKTKQLQNDDKKIEIMTR